MTIKQIIANPDADLSEWDKFRLEAYYMADELNTTYNFNCTTYQLYDWLTKTIYAECKYSHEGKGGVNKITDARGAIQFMPSVRRRLDVPNNIDKLSLVEQMPYIKRYFHDVINTHHIYGKDVSSFVDVYLIVFGPAHTGSKPTKSIYTSCTYRKKQCSWYKLQMKGKRGGKRCAYHANSGYDHLDSNGKRNKDGRITKEEIADYIINKHYKNN